MEGNTREVDGVRIAVEGCGHGTLDAIYETVTTAAGVRGWDGVDLLIIGGDFQAARNAADLSVMSVPAKYRQLADFPAYYSGEKKAPYLTIFISGNHEASSYLWELYYGGWVAPNIYYMGPANVLRFGPLRIAGMSGIWKGFDYRKPHQERLPFSRDDIKSFYHVREIDVRKLLLLREQVDIGLSHDWPRAIEKHGNSNALWKMKPDFKKESFDGTLGNPAAAYVMDRLRPAYWYSAHLHCKFAAVKTYDAPQASNAEQHAEAEKKQEASQAVHSETEAPSANPEEVDLDMDDEEDKEPVASDKVTEANPAEPSTASPSDGALPGQVSDDIRAQLPASFAKQEASEPKSKTTPGQPVPPTITNTTTRFLALDKCLPGRKFIQLVSSMPVNAANLTAFPPSSNPKQRYRLQYDPEWLAITRVFSEYLTIGDATAQDPPDLGEDAYLPIINAERQWVEEHIVSQNKLDVPENFAITAPPHRPGVDPEFVNYQPDEYTNPQTTAFCELAGVPNLWDATPEEREERKKNAPPPSSQSSYGPSGSHRGGRGRGRGHGGGRGGGRGGWRGRR
ncbi:lariat debranching enzyme, C-terminal domain-containing protein [Hypoxylon sp. FL1284]|nr:lariat debranching enzyme, C-terminal domain-containing protein [Hypoxylon sp. FL1284]